MARDNTVSVRLTEDERKILEQIAEIRKMSLSQALRSLIREPEIPELWTATSTIASPVWLELDNSRWVQA